MPQQDFGKRWYGSNFEKRIKGLWIFIHGEDLCPS